MKLVLTTICMILLSSYAPGRNQLGQYYRNLDKAEEFIIKKEYKKAILKYKAAIKLNPAIFSNADCLNAIQCYVKSSASHAESPFIRLLLSRGVPESYFMDNYDHLDYDFEQEVKSVVDSALIAIVDSMYLMDQQYRYDYEGYYPLIKRIDSLNRVKLERLINKYGYFRNQLGSQVNNDGRITGDSKLDDLLIHQVKNDPKYFAGILENEVFSGRMSREAFYFHSKNFQHINRYNLGCDQYLLNSIFIRVRDNVYTCCCDREKIANKNRKKFYLNKLETVRFKTKFAQSNPEFRLGSNIVTFNSSKGEQDYDLFVKELLDKGFVLFRE